MRASHLSVPAALTVGLAVIAFALLQPGFLVSIDGAIKLLQTESLLASGFTSTAIPYHGASFDTSRQYVPFGPPFVFEHDGTLQGVYPIAVALLSSPFILLGSWGLVVPSLLAAFAALWATSKLGSDSAAVALPVLLALCTMFWAYAVVPWEHMPALACSTVAFVLLPGRVLRTTFSGALLGFGIVLRGETVLLLPWFVLAHSRHLSREGRIGFSAGLLLPFLLAGAVDTLLYDRTPFAHLAHAVDFIWRVVGSEPTIERPLSLSLQQQADLVLQNWVFGFPAWLGVSVSAVLVGLYVTLRGEARAAVILAALVLVLVIACRDLIVFGQEPAFVAGIVRNSPFLLLALIPLAPGARARDGRRLELIALLIYLLGLFSTSRDGGVQIGPRFLLPVLPLAVKLSWETWQSYRDTRASGLLSLVAPLGAALALCSFLTQATVNYATLSRLQEEEHPVVEELREARSETVIMRDVFLINLVAPVYQRSKVLMADTDEKLHELLEHLAKEGAVRIAIVQTTQMPPPRLPGQFAMIRKYSSPATSVFVLARAMP